MKAIYGIVNKLNGKKYIGSAVNFYKRKSLHLKQLTEKCHHSKYLQRAWNKYGGINFEFIILERVDSKENLIPREQWWLDNSNNEYNVCKTAGSPLGVKRSKATKDKCRLAHLGKNISDEHKANIRKTCSHEMMVEKQKLSIISRKKNNKPLSDKRRAEISKTNSVSIVALGDNICHIFPSYKEASIFLGKSEVTLWRIITSQKKYKEFIWKRKDYVQSSQ